MMHAQELTALYFALAEKEGGGPALAIIGARYGDELAEVLRQSLEDDGVFAPPKTYNDGLEAAALYHDELAGVCETLGGDYTIDSAAHKDAALVHRRQAIEIRALKVRAETD